MSFPTQPAFVMYAKGWDENLLAHPMMKFLHAHEVVFDAKKWDECLPFYAPNCEYTKPNGLCLKGDAAIEGMKEDYALFVDCYREQPPAPSPIPPSSFFVFHCPGLTQNHTDEPVYGIIVDIPGGHRLYGYARLYVNLPVPGEKKFKDLEGREWECQAHGSFLFDVVKDATGPLGYKFTAWQTFADSSPILVEAIKRGIVPVEAITGGTS
jgi:hypothetical protein